jgi:hypothetical protein
MRPIVLVANEDLQAGDIVVYQGGLEATLLTVARGEFIIIGVTFSNVASPDHPYQAALRFPLVGTTMIRQRSPGPLPRYERDEPL